jgi:probable rRNA maturation factor
LSTLDIEYTECREVTDFSKYLPDIVAVFKEFLFVTSPFHLAFSSSEIVQVDISLVSNEEIQQLNKEHRDKDKPTDVLSFPIFEDLRELENQSELRESGPVVSLGSIIVGEGVLSKQAQEYQLSESEELAHLITHGLLHLCGYDHEINDEEDRVMRSLESELIDRLAKRRNN